MEEKTNGGISSIELEDQPEICIVCKFHNEKEKSGVNVYQGENKKEKPQLSVARCEKEHMCSWEFKVTKSMMICCGNKRFGMIGVIDTQVKQKQDSPSNYTNSDPCLQWLVPGHVLDQWLNTIYIRYKKTLRLIQISF